jgi:zona occludens toxin
MAVTAYVGEPGSGKTYEVVTEVVLLALREGRRVVSNIRGLHFDEMKAYLMVDCGVAEDKIGELALVEVEDPGKPDFFYTETNQAAVVRPGDLVVLDECWRWFAKGMPINKAMFEFFRMHRQYVDAKGVSCDVVLISQSIQDIDRKVLVVVEKHFRMEKYKAFGSKKRYSVEMFNGYKVSGNPRIRLLVRKYNPRFFPFYSSYAGKGGDEREVDKRFNIWKSPFFLFVVPCSVMILGLGVWGVLRFLSAKAPKPAPAASQDKAGTLVAPAVISTPAVPPVSEWRSVGIVSREGRLLFVVEQEGRYRFMFDSPDYRIDGLDIKVSVDGRAATGFSGSASRAGIANGLGK